MKPGQRLTIIIVALVSVLVWALVSGLALPRWHQLTQLREQEALAKSKIARLERLARRKPAIERTYAQYADYYSHDPDGMAQRIFLDELEQLAGSGDVQLNLAPKVIKVSDKTPRTSVELEVDGTQDALLNFLDRLLAWPKLIEIERLRIAASPSKDHPLRATLTVNKLLVKGHAVQTQP